MQEFRYLIEKIEKSTFFLSPFKHLYIEDYLSPKHLEHILQDEEVHFEQCKNTRDLNNKLISKGYAIQSFPGCIQNIEEYIYRFETNNPLVALHGNPIESVGVTYRKKKYKNAFTEELISFLNSQEFHDCLRAKFEITEETRIISAIQKNLSKYEISPHPDVRKKSLTYLLNINKTPEFDNSGQHTHLLQFKDEYRYVYDYWKNNPEKERTWVPWEWCETKKMHSNNNAFVIFEPSNDTLHAVKLDYDHTIQQRTQVYGNLMYPGRKIKPFDDGKYRYLETLKTGG